MSNIIKGQFGKAAQLKRIKRSSLCQHGHHRWEVDTTTRFGVKEGKLLTVSICSKYGKTKTSAD
tara:strand:- start:563 stop:754 length:192 start_codon:yes stop_codon:yes gene_type:complete